MKNDILELNSLNIEILDDEALTSVAGGCSSFMCSLFCCSIIEIDIKPV